MEAGLHSLCTELVRQWVNGDESGDVAMAEIRAYLDGQHERVQVGPDKSGDMTVIKRLADDLQEARDAVSEWASHASEQFRQTHGLQGELDRIDRQIQSAREHLNRRR